MEQKKTPTSASSEAGKGTEISMVHGLEYKSFSVILMQTFVPKVIKPVSYNTARDIVDKQIFLKYGSDFVKRYELPDINIKINLCPKKDVHNTIEGVVKVQAAVYFKRAVSLTYRFVVDKKSDSFCKTAQPFTTNHLTLLSGIVQGVEHWEKHGKEYHINNDSAYKVEVNLSKELCGESIIGGHECIERVQKIYKSIFVDDEIADNDKWDDDYHYTYVDIWEDIDQNSNPKFENFTEAKIIEHIDNDHKPELIGLMSLYPFEWPYRTASEFSNICGNNIAIDTDDLVLTNENMTLVVGTYGSRGEESPTEWKEHLEIRAIYHTSWVEYLILVELAIIKKTVITYVLSRYVQNISRINSQNKAQKADIKEIIHENALLNIHLTSVISKLDIARYLRYMSHKHMYKKCYQNLSIDEDMAQLEYITNNSDVALNNANNIRELKQANQTNLILGIISVASLLEIVLTEAKIHLFEDIGLKCVAGVSGRIIVFITIALIILTSVRFIKYILGNARN